MCFTNSLIPKYLYKYYQWENVFDEGRLNGDVFFSSPLNFNDLLDCNMPIINNIEKFDKDESLRKIKELFPEEEITIYDKLKKNDTTEVERVYKKQRQLLGILCLAKRSDNPILWSRYSYNSGYCIEFETSCLLDSIKKAFEKKRVNWESRKRIFCQWVTYKNTLDEDRNLFFKNHQKEVIKKYWTKHSEWSTEEEYRIGVSLGGDTKINANVAIRKIFIGCNPKLENYIHCLSLLRNINLPIKVINVKDGRYKEEDPSWDKMEILNIIKRGEQ